MKRRGVLLLNLGTPDDPSPKKVAVYLREFLMDPYVINIPFVFRWLLVNLIIAPFRSKKSSHAYKKIWTIDGSPLLVNLINLRDQIQNKLGSDFMVEAGMRYQNPTVDVALLKLQAAGIEEVLFIPLYPQYADSSSTSSIRHLKARLEKLNLKFKVRVLEDFYKQPFFIDSFVQVIRDTKYNSSRDHLLMSFHGLPEEHMQSISQNQCGACLKTPACEKLTHPKCYRGQCYETARAIAHQLNLPASGYSVSFQSRLGRAEWIKPYTTPYLEKLARAGSTPSVYVACPAFVADCLETLEEIAIREKEQFLGHGGQALELIPSLNAHPVWVKNLSNFIKSEFALTKELE